MPNRKAGKLETATRHNLLHNDVVLSDAFVYGDAAGRLTEKITTVTRNGTTRQTFRQSFTYDETGQTQQHVYPQCATTSPCGSNSAFTRPEDVQSVSRQYSFGFLSSISGYTGAGGSPLTYWPNGMIAQVRGPAVTESHGQDPNLMRRPRSISIAGWQESGGQSPVITVQPANVTTLYNTSTTLTVTVNSSTTVTYQWYRGVRGDQSQPVGNSSSTYETGALSSTTPYWVLAQNAYGVAYSNTATVAVAPHAPASVVASYSGASSVSVTWNAGAGAESYEVQRKSNGGAFSPLGTTAGTSFFDLAAGPGVAYVYQVIALRAGVPSSRSNRDLATSMTPAFTPLVAGETPVTFAHFEEIRGAINTVLAAYGHRALGWEEITGTPWPAPGALVAATHIVGMRLAMEWAVNTCGVAAWTYTDPSPAGQAIRVVHLEELRGRIR